MTVPYTFGTATTSIPLSNLDSNFNTPITLGNTSIYLGNTTTTIGNLTLTNVTISSGTANITSNITYATANAVVFTNSSSIGTTGANLTFDGTTFTASSIKNSALTSGRVTYAGASGLLTDSAGLTFDGTIFQVKTGNTAATQFRIAHSTVANFYADYNEKGDLTVGRNSWSAGVTTEFSTTSATSTYTGDLAGGFSFKPRGNLAVTIAGNGSVGIGTSSPVAPLNIVGQTTSTSTPILYLQQGGSAPTYGYAFKIDNQTTGNLFLNRYDLNNTDIGALLTVTTAGNVGIGTTSPVSNAGYSAITVSNTTGGQIFWKDTNTSVTGYAGVDNGIAYLATETNHPLVFRTNNAEKMRLDTSGNLLVGDTSYTTSKFRVLQSAAEYTSRLQNSNASPVGLSIYYSGASPNGTGNSFIYAEDSTALRFEVRSNGGIANYSANDVNLSDRREKTNFALATSYLDKICAIPVQTFNYIDQNLEQDDGLTLGVVAQDVQAVAPELVMESNWGTKEEPKMRLSIYQTDLQYALMKCIQEQQALIESLTTRLTALESK